jgi:hypothetical protein
MTNDTRIHFSWYAFLLVAFLFVFFGYGKLFEPGPPYDDPLGGLNGLQSFVKTVKLVRGS